MMFKQRNFLAITLAVILHVAILSLFIFSYFHSQPNVYSPGQNVSVINAVAINNAQVIQQPFKIPKPSQVSATGSQSKQPLLKKIVAKQQVVKAQSPVPPKREQTAPVATKPVINKTADVVAVKEKLLPKQNQPHKSAVVKREPKLKPKKIILHQDTLAQRKAELAKELASNSSVQAPLDPSQEAANVAKDSQALLNQDLKSDQSSDPTAVATQSKAEQGIINKYKALIKAAIEQHWNVPADANADLSCDLLITLAPGGSVLNVAVAKSSGMPALDQSALQAVYQASPLPIPADANLFEQFRQLSLTVKPEQVLGG